MNEARANQTPSDSMDPSPPPQDLPDDSTLFDALTYGLTLPERTARSASAVVGGLVHETAGWLIPAAFRSSKTYSAFIGQSLDMMIHDVGGVTKNQVPAAENEEAALAQKAVGGLLDLAGAATLHLSPLTVLAVFNDLAYGSSHYLKRLSEELKREGIIDQDSSIDHVSDLVDALQQTGARASKAAEAPPMSLEAMISTIGEITQQVQQVDPTRLIPQSELTRMWQQMESVADDTGVGIWDVSTTMTMFAIDRLSLSTRGALSTVRVAGSLLDEHFFAHYGDALVAIRQDGFYETLSNASTPYLDAVWHNFDAKRETLTEELVTGRMPRRLWSSFVCWFKSRGDERKTSERSGGKPLN
ncbi:hypothetical protein [Rhodopirellula sp. MGV]|uniref:hypothetical protein n=1 Tax=Rhodopirellula sp. MGV TaxID=2023130 RepID=UPI000B97353E|nr:hypothetical protein [Rhodopirellula sp. MGV]OYP35441.1 hypothetical protein CGZ80_11385 [Rhodopirellula sp. MGV]PNY33881.1 hypothetical protein C2E31_26010 [Rhodopirellula baltica]